MPACGEWHTERRDDSNKEKQKSLLLNPGMVNISQPEGCTSFFFVTGHFWGNYSWYHDNIGVQTNVFLTFLFFFQYWAWEKANPFTLQKLLSSHFAPLYLPNPTE